MTKIFHLTPFQSGNIGGGINDSISLLPVDAWVCIRDADTMFLTPRQQQQLVDIASADPEFDVIGCMTNRLRSPHQTHGGQLSDEPDIRIHMQIAEELERARYGELVELPAPNVVAGMLMLFRVSLWETVKFTPRSIYFDKQFCSAVRARGGKLAIAKGIYLFHLYRFNKPDPCNYLEHLK
ncbi:hypothetical protein [Serratia sp. M24T3]|uniref:hypothetical protein n=1 Tax=Serratia sp. M24T3 TaxID=932213 RepID=UPI00025BA809|nr:hypothetical protein [Serratia sp. M24T3]EIC82165.1 hypothetical protein SPM24T3_23317 [Serratia sp. M24T3]